MCKKCNGDGYYFPNKGSDVVVECNCTKGKLVKKCVLCLTNDIFFGIEHKNGNGVCLKCVIAIKDAHIKVREFPYEEAEANA